VGNDKPVWFQVLGHFGRIASCQPAVLSALRGLLQAQQQQQQPQIQTLVADGLEDEIADLIRQVVRTSGLEDAMAGLNLQA